MEIGNGYTLGTEAGSWHCRWHRCSTRRHNRVEMMEDAAWNCTIDHSPRNGKVFAEAAVQCSDRYKVTVGSPEGEQQIESEG